MATLLFHWHADGKLNTFQKIHLYYFHKYKHLFDEIRISLANDNTKDIDLINETIKWFDIDQITNIKFNVIPNHKIYRESQTFNDNIFGENAINDLTFFAHSKKSDYGNLLSISYWIASMWFFNLENSNTILTKLKNENYVCSGILKTFIPNWKGQKYGWHYSGAFYWFNPIELRKCNPIISKDRFYVETILGRYFPSNLAYDSNNCNMNNLPNKFHHDNYLNLQNDIKYLFDEELFNKFEEEFQNVLKTINSK